MEFSILDQGQLALLQRPLDQGALPALPGGPHRVQDQLLAALEKRQKGDGGD